MASVRCQTEDTECDHVGEFVYETEDGPKRVCAEHYQAELKLDLFVWSDDFGSFCAEEHEKPKLVHQFVDRHNDLPCLCVKHLAVAMRNDPEIAAKVSAAFKEDMERLADEILSENMREQKERAKLEQFLNKLEA